MKKRLWMAAGFVALALYAVFVWPIPAIVGRHTQPPVTPQEQAELYQMDHPRIISKELANRFHRIGDGLILGTDSGTFEFIASDGCGIISPEDALASDKFFGANGYDGDEVAKQPIYLIKEDAGDGPIWILRQMQPGEKNLDGSPHIEECSITPNN